MKVHFSWIGEDKRTFSFSLIFLCWQKSRLLLIIDFVEIFELIIYFLHREFPFWLKHFNSFVEITAKRKTSQVKSLHQNRAVALWHSIFQYNSRKLDGVTNSQLTMILYDMACIFMQPECCHVFFGFKSSKILSGLAFTLSIIFLFKECSQCACNFIDFWFKLFALLLL